MISLYKFHEILQKRVTKTTLCLITVLSIWLQSKGQNSVYTSRETVITYQEAARIKNGEITEQELLARKLLAYSFEEKIDQADTFNSTQSAARITAPSNDDCSNAITLTIGGGDYTYSNVGATTIASDPTGSGWSSCTGGPGNNTMNTVWFKFTVTGGPLNITVSSQGPYNSANSTADKALYAVYSGSCGSLTEIGTTRAGTYGNYNSKSINIANLANGTYYIETDGLCAQTGTYRIRVDLTPSGSPTLWYAAGAIPILSTGVPVTTCGQWGTYAATSELNPMCGAAGLGFSDWYQFVYNSATQDQIGITDQDIQAAFYIGLYNSSGTELVCNKWGQADYASYTWDLSAQDGIPMHMPNVSLKELGLTNGATYYVRVASTASSYLNVNTNAGKIYTIRVGSYTPAGDSYLDNVTLSVTQQPTYSWLTGQTNRYCGHSMLTEPEQGNLVWNIDNSLMYKFNSNSATTVFVKLQNVTYYNHTASTAQGQMEVLTAPQFGTSVASISGFSGSPVTLTVTGLTPFTDYWVSVDGQGTYEGTKLTFDISVSTTVAVLPIDLISFNGNYDGTKNIISWTTSTEENNNYFTVERSMDATNFTKVQEINGYLKSDMNKNYSIIDEIAYSGIAYYRLKQTDIDGQSSYSGIISISHDDDLLSKLQLSPNPSGEAIVTANFSLPDQTTADICIFSVTGELLKKQTSQCKKGDNHIPIELSGFSKGLYFLSISANNTVQRIRLIRE